MVGGVNPHTKTEWSSDSCKLGDTSINSIPITHISYNNQWSSESSFSRCKWSEKGEYCRKRQRTSRIKSQKIGINRKNLSKNATRSNIDSKKKSDKAIKHWKQAQDYVQQKNVLRKNLIKR